MQTSPRCRNNRELTSKHVTTDNIKWEQVHLSEEGYLYLRHTKGIYMSIVKALIMRMVYFQAKLAFEVKHVKQTIAVTSHRYLIYIFSFFEVSPEPEERK